MFGRYREVQLYAFVGVGVQRAFHQMLFQRRPRAVGITVEFEQPLGQISVAQSFFGKKTPGNGRAGSGGDVVTIGGHNVFQVMVKGEFFQILEKLLGRFIGFILFQKSEERLEHAGSRAGSGDELEQRQIVFVDLQLKKPDLLLYFIFR